MRIRFARAADLPAIAALLAGAGLAKEDSGAHLATTMVGVSRRGIVAVGALEPLGDICLLRSVAVAPAWRGLGWGRRMSLRLLDYARSIRTPEVYLLTTTAADFFVGLGFRTLSRDQAPIRVRATRQFSALCPASAAFMHLSLEEKE